MRALPRRRVATVLAPGEQHESPLRPWKPSLTATPAIARAASGSAHHQPRSRSRRARRAARRYRYAHSIVCASLAHGGSRPELACEPGLRAGEQRHRRRRHRGESDADPARARAVADDQGVERLHPDVAREQEEAPAISCWARRSALGELARPAAKSQSTTPPASASMSQSTRTRPARSRTLLGRPRARSRTRRRARRFPRTRAFAPDARDERAPSGRLVPRGRLEQRAGAHTATSETASSIRRPSAVSW